ncbi:MAG: tRNA lysidine(34) synthetase TilS [Anaerolineae bacterium]
MTLLDQLRHTIAKHDLLERGSLVIVGVSGGADSVCLLHALHTLAPEYDIKVHVAHLDHQLRGDEARADADFVRDLAHRWALPYSIESRDVAAFARAHKLSIEEAARQVRYGFLIDVAAAQNSATIAVAHHADDQTESVLMHFLRGSGLAGLRGMRPKTKMVEVGNWKLDSAFKDVHLIRPLLDVPRADIEAYCTEHGLSFRTDATNADTTYFRNRLRHELLPLLETYNPNIRTSLRRTADVVQADYELLEAHRNFAWDMTLLDETDTAITFSLSAWREQPIGTQRALLRRAIQQLRSSLRDINFVHVEDAVDLLQRATTGDQATLPQNLILDVSYDSFTIAPRDQLALPDWPQLPEGLTSLSVNMPGLTPLPESTWTLEATFVTDRPDEPSSSFEAYLDADQLIGPLVLRPRQSADRFQPSGLLSPLRLKDWLIGVKVPRLVRDQLPLLVAGDTLAWVPGVRVGQSFIVTEQTRRIVKLIFQKI